MSSAIAELAGSLRAAYARRELVAPPSSRDASFDLDAAYDVESELRRLGRAEGRRVVGLKVGYANRAVWRALKLETLVWAAMYDDTVRHAAGADAQLSVARMTSAKIEPEIVVKLARPIASAEAPAVLESIEWFALGFELIDCVYPDWKFQPADFVAAYGLHAALLVGEPTRVTPAHVPQLVEQLAQFKVRLSRNGQLVEEGGGKNALRSPALCVGELAAALGRRTGAEPLEAGHLVSTGTLTTSQPCAAGERWTADVEGLDVGALSVTLV
jgi:2-oxo-3-hexenedioate decarboxylase